LKYINSELKVKFDLDMTSKPKPVAGPDDLLLLLTHHWARDESVLPTEDDRHDVATITLFQAYTGARPAEFVHASRAKRAKTLSAKQKRRKANGWEMKITAELVPQTMARTPTMMTTVTPAMALILTVIS
jgi:hypothetical protein